MQKTKKGREKLPKEKKKKPRVIFISDEHLEKMGGIKKLREKVNCSFCKL